MAHSLSAKKRHRQNIKRRAINRARKGDVKKQIKKFMEVTKQASDAQAAEVQLRLAQKKVDKLAAKGIMHKNAAAREKSRMARQLNAIKKAKAV